MKNIFVRSLAVLLVCLFAISGFNFSVFASNDAGLGDTLTAANIEIRGKIILMLYFKNLDNVEYFEVKIPQPDESVAKIKISKSQLTYDTAKDRYLLAIPLAAAQQSDEISFQAFDGNGNAGKLRTYSIAKYAEQLFALAKNNPDIERYAKAAQAVRAMLNYGAMAQTYFRYNQTNMANEGLYYRGTNPVYGMGYEDIYGVAAPVSSNVGNGSVKFTSVNAYLEETLSLRFYFEYTGTAMNSPEELKVTIEGEDYTNKNEIFCDEFGRYYVLVNNIPSTCFNTQYQVRVGEDSNNYAEIKYSVMNYLQARFEHSYDQKFADVAYSMFQFYAWTKEYVGESVVPSPSSCAHERTHITASDQLIVCSDCGQTQGTAENVGAFNVDQSGNVTTTSGSSYLASGGDFAVDAERGFTGITKEKKLTISGGEITSSTQTNRFHLHYYASAPAKITMNYTYGANKEKTASEYYYLEAGENTFSAVEWSFLASKGDGPEWDKIIYYGENQNWTLASITVEPLKDSVDFVLFDYSTETVDTSKISSTTYGGDVTCYLIYLSSTRYKLGVNLTWGGAISELYDLTANSGSITSGTNLVNRSDAGRLIQQSYYGSTGSGDGYESHYWSSNPGVLDYAKWNYNPVQGGDANNSQSRIIDFEIGDNYVYVKAQPRDWANHVSNGDGTFTNVESRYTECYMENRYTMMNGGTANNTADDYIRVDNRMVDYSGYNHPCTTQELPAFYTLAYFDDYYWYNGNQPWTGTLTKEDNLPFWGDPQYASRTTFNYQTSNTETWGAFVNETTKYGLGMYVPNIDIIKGGRVDGSESNKVADSTSGYSSYFAPLKELQIVCYEPIEYSYLLCAGQLDTIRSVFSANKDFESNKSLDENSISQKIPTDTDITSIDFSKKENLVLLDSVTDASLSYDIESEAAKFVVTGNDSYFLIDYTSLQDFNATTYPAASYTCIEFEYMIPADPAKYPGGLVAGQQLFYQVGANSSPNGTYSVPEFVTLIADGKWHTARYYTSNIGANWTGNINSLRIDFLNNALGAGQTFYLKSFSITNDTPHSLITTLGFGSVFSGQALVDQLTDGAWEHSGAATWSILNGDCARAVVGNINDRYVGFVLGGTVETGKYMVIKYRTAAVPIGMNCSVFASSGSNEIMTLINGKIDCEGKAYGIVGDGKWHTLVVDLSKISDDVSATGTVMLNQVRIDLFDCFAPGTVIDFAYIGFCDDISKAQSTLEDGEHLDYGDSDRNWSLSVDSVEMDGVPVTKNGTELAIGAAQTSAPTIEGSVWKCGGWFAIDGSDITTVECGITEADGTENWFPAKLDGNGVRRYYAAEQGVKDYVTQNKGFSASTVPYRLYLEADLRNYVGQTVTISIRATTTDDRSIIIYYVKVKVASPEYSSLDFVLAADDLYNEMFGGDNDAISSINKDNPEVRKNADGSVSVTVTEKTVNNTTHKWIGIQPKGKVATGGYMVIRYRTSATPANRKFYLYTASDGESVMSEDNKMTSFGFVGDGNWHTLVIDLSVAKAVNGSLDYKYHISDIRLQMLDQLATGSVIDFAYIGFCNSIKDVPVYDGEMVEYGWDEWVVNIDSAYMGGDVSDANYFDGTKVTGVAVNANIGPDQNTVLDGTTWALNGWFGFNGQSVEKLSISITNMSGVEEYKAAIEPTTAGVPSRWYSTDEITNHLINSASKYSYGTVGYRFNLSQDLSAFAGQTVTLALKALTSEGHEVIIYRVKINVPGTFAPQKWNASIDAFYHAQDSAYATLATISGASTSSVNGTTIRDSSSDYASISASYIQWNAGWLVINGHDISGVTYTVYSSSGTTLLAGDVPLIAAEEGVVSYVTNGLGYVGSTPYRINAASAPVINLSAYVGQTVTLVFSATVPNTANSVEIIRINVTVTAA
ncbi:MAG: hypothetical protein IKJ07_07090 [Clostridia bacterium]|nr:hypothetical protein [Clostridia bacterium]